MKKERLMELAGVQLNEAAGITLTIKVSPAAIKEVVRVLEEDFEFQTTPANLVASKEFIKWLNADASNLWHGAFEDGLSEGLESLNLNKIKGKHIDMD